jgi:hypothetical protein
MFYFVYYYIILYYDPLSSSIDHFIPQFLPTTTTPNSQATKDLAAVAACLAAAASGADLLPRSRRDLVAWHLDLWMTG